MAMFGGYLNPKATAGLAGGGSVSSGSLTANSVTSGIVGSGAVTGQAGGGNFVIASGTISANDVGSGAILSGHIGSGQIGGGHVASGQLTGLGGAIKSIASGTFTGFELGSGSIVSGRVASGQIGSYHQQSGFIADNAQYTAPIVSGINRAPAIITQEIISGVKAVGISQSGNLWIAMASVSGRMPAIGIVVDNILSGRPATVYTHGAFQAPATVADYSGWLGKPVWVGRSGEVVQWSGSFNSGGLNIASGGDFVQRLGVVINSGAFLANVVLDMGQTQLLGTTAITNVENRAFGV